MRRAVVGALLVGECFDDDQARLLEKFKYRMVHWFSLLNAVSTMSLNGGEVAAERSSLGSIDCDVCEVW